MNIAALKNLKVIFPTEGGVIRAVEGVSIDIPVAKCVALVGESGCGKSVTALAMMKLLSSPPSLWQADEIMFDGEDIKNFSDRQMQKIRGSKMTLVFQDALTALNPVMSVGRQIAEVYVKHGNMNKSQAKESAIRALELVGVPSPRSRYNDFPHQLSGGMRQRVLIAIAFACQPKLIIADEPTTALDVTIQAQILDLLNSMRIKHNVSLLLITHDLSVVANSADIIYVMYSGKIVEKASKEQLFKNPLHPYTKGLLGSIPRLDDGGEHRFVQIPDSVPHPMHKPDGCVFHPRCAFCKDICKTQMPKLITLPDGRQVRCHLIEEGGNV